MSHHSNHNLVRASYLEIYQEEIRDLLSKDQAKRLQLKERGDTGVQVKVLHITYTCMYRTCLHIHLHRICYHLWSNQWPKSNM